MTVLKPAAYVSLLLVLVACKQHTGVDVDEYPSKVIGTWEYVTETQYFLNKEGKPDSTVLDAKNRLAVTRTEIGINIDKLFLSFSADSSYQRDHYNSGEQRTEARQVGKWFFRKDTLYLGTKGGAAAYDKMLGTMPSDSALIITMSLDEAKHESYKAVLKKIR